MARVIILLVVMCAAACAQNWECSKVVGDQQGYTERCFLKSPVDGEYISIMSAGKTKSGRPDNYVIHAVGKGKVEATVWVDGLRVSGDGDCQVFGALKAEGLRQEHKRLPKELRRNLQSLTCPTERIQPVP